MALGIELMNGMSPQIQRVTGNEIAPNSPVDDRPLSEVDFSKIFKSALDNLNVGQVHASEKMKQVELGKSDDLVGAMVSSQKASLNFSMLVQIRNKVVTGFEQIMRMPV